MIMPRRTSLEFDSTSPPFDRLRHIQRLAPERSGRPSVEHGRHHLFVARDTESRTNVLIKLTSRPGLIYQQNLANEIASLSTINRELPDSRDFPYLHAHGRLDDGRVYLIMSLFDESPLAAAITAERVPARMVGHLMTAMEMARALESLHGVGIVHADLNPMNVLHRSTQSRPVIRIIDFESSYDVARHGAGEVYNPSVTAEFSAPEVPRQTPDARADIYSLGAVLYTMLTGFGWTWESNVTTAIERDGELDAELKDVLRTAVAREPAGRHASMQALGSALAAYLEHIWPGRSW
jgi:serine/threonine protein kinase